MRNLKLFLSFLLLGAFLFHSNPCRGQSLAQKAVQKWPGEVSQWHGYQKFDFQVDGRDAYVVQPKTAAPGNPWVFRARFPDYHPEADLILLERGFHLARIDTDGMLGSPQAMQYWDKFYSFIVENGLAKRAALEGVSRGGLFVYNFAAKWPERVACIYCDTPVCDIKSWPGGKGAGKGDAATWQHCLNEYGLTEESAVNFKASPIDILEPIAEAKIPLLHIVSLNDTVVPVSENTNVLAERFRALGGRIDMMEVAEGTAESSGHHFMHPAPIRVADFIERHATVLPSNHDYFELRGSLDNCRIKFEQQKTGTVAFMGGSITEMSGWRELTKKYLQERFPETKFEFIDAGISSTGSTPGAFRLLRDVFPKGDVDLFFEEAAVNDLHNSRTPVEITRGMEGIVRQARLRNPQLDIVVLHFVDPNHMADYRDGKVPMVIERQENVARHYDVSTIQLAQEVTERIDAGQFDWEHDFRDLHPSPYGHEIYAATIRRLLSTAWSVPLKPTATVVAHPIPEPLDRFSYAGGKMIPLSFATIESGFTIIPKCDPRENQVGGSVRDGFHNVPMLVGTDPGDTFSFSFTGSAVDLFVAAGPDAGIINYSIDGGQWRSQDLFTRWSTGLHIPWVYILDSELDPGDHRIEIKIAEEKNESSKGTACRIVNLLANEDSAAKQTPELPELRVLTYNIHHGEGTDGKFDHDRLTEVISRTSPDIVALQEVDKGTERADGMDQAAELAKRLKMHYVFGNALYYSGGEYGEAILSKFPLDSAQAHHLPYRFGSEPRTALAATVRPDNGLPEFVFVGTHLCHQSEEVRVDQTKELNKLFGKRLEMPVILTGDLNARPPSEPIKELLSTNWIDTNAPNSRIDYILVRKTDPWDIVESTTIDVPVVSDHNPVLTILRWTSEPK